MKGATFRRVPPPEPKPRKRIGAVHLEPPMRPLKKFERASWLKMAKRLIADGRAYDRPSISNYDLRRLLETLEVRERQIRDLERDVLHLQFALGGK